MSPLWRRSEAGGEPKAKSARRPGGGLDLTQGPIVRGAVLFTLPLLASSLIQQLYNTVDMLYAGNVLGTAGSATLGVSMLLITCLICFFNGLSIGATVVVARLLGSGDYQATRDAVQTAFILGLFGGIAVAILGWAFAGFYLEALHTPPEIMKDALFYLRVYFISAIVVMLYNMCAGVVRALGNSAKTLQAQLVGGLLNVAADWLFLVGFGWGIAGLAVATLFSQGLAALVLLVYLCRMDSPYRLVIRESRINAEHAREMIRLGVPAGTQTLLMALSNVYAQFHINTLGTTAMASFATYFKVELIFYLPVVAFAQASTTFVAQNLGAERKDRARKGARTCILIGIVWCIAIAAFMPIWAHWGFWIFNQDPEVIEIGLRIAWIAFPLYSIYALQDILGATIRGWGKSTEPMVIVLVNICIVRCIIIGCLMAAFHSVEAIAVSYPITWVTSAICMLIVYRRISR